MPCLKNRNGKPHEQQENRRERRRRRAAERAKLSAEERRKNSTVNLIEYRDCRGIPIGVHVIGWTGVWTVV